MPCLRCFFFCLLFHHAADFDAFGQGDAEGVETGGEAAEVEGGLTLECCHVAACVVIDIHAYHLFVSLDGQDTCCRVGVEGEAVSRGLHAVAVVRHVALGSGAEVDVVDIVAAVVARLPRGQDIAESDVVAGARVGGEVDCAEHEGGGGGVVEGGDRHKCAGVGEAGHHAHLQLVLGLSLLEVEGELQAVDIAGVTRHGVDAALVEDEAVVAAVGCGGAIVNHGLVLVGHSDILLGEGPAVGLHAGLGGGGGGVGVEVVGEGELVGIDGAAGLEAEVVDVVAAVVARLSGGEDIAESDVVTASGVGGEVDGAVDVARAGVIEGGDSDEGGGVGETGHDTDLELVLGLGLLEVHAELEGLDGAVEVRHGVDAALVEDEGVVAAVGVGGVVVDHWFVGIGDGNVLMSEGPAGRLSKGLGFGGGSVGVEVVGIGEVGDGDAALLCAYIQSQVVDEVATEVARVAGCKDIAESYVAAVARVGGKVYRDIFNTCGAVVECDDRGKGGGVAEVGEDTHLESVFGILLLEVEGKLEGVHVGVDRGHGVDAAFVDEERILTAVCVIGFAVNHGFVVVGDGYILMDENPAVGFYSGLGGGGCGVGVEVVGIGQFIDRDAATFRTDGEGEVVDVGSAGRSCGDGFQCDKGAVASVFFERGDVFSPFLGVDGE